MSTMERTTPRAGPPAARSLLRPPLSLGFLSRRQYAASLMAADEIQVTVGERTERLTHPDKVLFSAQGWTKQDLVDHYLECADGALRGVFNRPCVLKRWREGTAGKPFYQKRAPHSPGRTYAEVAFPSGRRAALVVPVHAADLVWMAHLGCLDLNPWPVRSDDLDRPDELRVDLDPGPGVGFESVRAVTRLIGEELEEHELTGWPKTSGSRGMHVLVRIAPEWSFTSVRRAALALARAVERRAPSLTTTAWWKEERHGVFIDYNQNARDRTVASAYSVRETGLVSAPLEWSEVDDADPLDFPMDRFAARWQAVGDCHAGIDAAPGRLDALLDLAARDEREGLGDAPWPPHFPKHDDEPVRAPPSRRRADPGDRKA